MGSLMVTHSYLFRLLTLSDKCVLCLNKRIRIPHGFILWRLVSCKSSMSLWLISGFWDVTQQTGLFDVINFICDPTNLPCPSELHVQQAYAMYSFKTAFEEIMKDWMPDDISLKISIHLCPQFYMTVIFILYRSENRRLER